ncbi:hypothetical protein ACFFX0_30595 [Citricoccus parietis]|uniref:Uncharacterized protein n=1 Tax=Citricoccus parietis TaxID=592307 RepID=A0ABV5G8M6_9MICC
MGVNSAKDLQGRRMFRHHDAVPPFRSNYRGRHETGTMRWTRQ